MKKHRGDDAVRQPRPSPTSATRIPSLSVGIAISRREIESAQRLRYQVFGEELGASLLCRTPRIDEDTLDPFCEHLVVRDNQSGFIAGTYRILSPENARAAGRYGTEEYFDITRLQHLFPRLVEASRACVHPDYRTGATIALLWAGLTRYMIRNGYDYLIGCCGIRMADGGHAAASLYCRLREFMGPVEYRAFPVCPLPLPSLRRDLPASVPPLLKGYLRAGAYILGEPAWNADFNTADLPPLLPMDSVSARYAHHFAQRGWQAHQNPD